MVGARCAGSPTAMLLARTGYRVLLVDRDIFPSDLPMSTHFIWQPGVARLQRWGLLDQIVASNCPPISKLTLDLGPFALTGYAPPADGVSVQEILTDGDCVTGIRGRTKGGSMVTEEARIVIGADGMHSLVARALRAPEYNTKPPLQGTYFIYWSGVPMNGLELYIRDYRATYGWSTNDNLALIGVNWAAKDFREVRADIEGHYFKVLAQAAPELAERVRGGKREARWIGGAISNFFRKPYGPGWALVGDAGYQKDPCTAQGISDAFRDAELLAQAIDAGLSGRRPLAEALADYERQRNETTMPMYEFTCQLATFEPPSPEMQHLFAALRGNQAETDQFWGTIAGTVPIPEYFSPENLQRIVGAA